MELLCVSGIVNISARLWLHLGKLHCITSFSSFCLQTTAAVNTPLVDRKFSLWGWRETCILASFFPHFCSWIRYNYFLTHSNFAAKGLTAAGESQKIGLTLAGENIKDGISSAGENIKDGISSAGENIKEGINLGLWWVGLGLGLGLVGLGIGIGVGVVVGVGRNNNGCSRR